MNVYDFDNTLYNGESIYDFFFFCLKKNKKLVIYLPKVIYQSFLYKKNKIDFIELINTCEVIISKFIKTSKYDINQLVEMFWDINICKLKDEFISKLTKEDIIITGSPTFLINYIKNKLKVDIIIGSEFDLVKGKITFLCLGENKVKIFKERFPDFRINNFYTDSLVDKPMMEISNNVYLVSGNNCELVSK